MPTDHTFAICAYGESPYLEECIRSALNQSVKTNVLIATSTPNAHIRRLAKAYGIPLFVREDERKGITVDWNFAIAQAKTRYVTITHQDDLYLRDYVRCLLSCMKKTTHPLIFFTDYGELREEEEQTRAVTANRLLRVKRLMLLPLRPRKSWGSRWLRRRSLSIGSAICCPSVTYVKPNLPDQIFDEHYRVSCDWEAWERLSKLEGEFVFCSRILMYHRIHKDSETTRQVENHRRSYEDLEIFRRFWPKPAARFIERWYRKAEDSNQL